jgi:hypothetical protein
VVTSDPIFFGSRSQLVRLAARHRLPTVYVQREFVEAGGLMSYGGNLAYQFRRAAVYVDKILKGRKTRRSAGRATDPIRPGREHENGEGPWHQDSQLGTGAGDEGDRVGAKPGSRTAGLRDVGLE